VAVATGLKRSRRGRPLRRRSELLYVDAEMLQDQIKLGVELDKSYGRGVSVKQPVRVNGKDTGELVRFVR
jgi:hypothetical protein